MLLSRETVVWRHYTQVGKARQSILSRNGSPIVGRISQLSIITVKKEEIGSRRLRRCWMRFAFGGKPVNSSSSYLDLDSREREGM